jgi:hypothetical protein
MSDTGGHIFLSHGSENRDEANAITHYLEERGLKVWIAPRNVRPGVDYSEALQEAIEACAAFIVLVTDKANKSPYVRVETEMAFSLHKPIFPVRTTDVKPGPGLALFLKIRHWTDAFGPGRDEGMDRLARELSVICGVPAEAPAETIAPAATATPSPLAPHPAPASAPPQTSGAAEAPAGDEELLRAFAGPNADHYLGRWRRGDGGGWHWPAFLFNAVWLAYRKMWGLAGGFLGAVLLLLVVSAFSMIVYLVLLVPLIAAAAWLGLNASRLYRRHAEAQLAQAGAAAPDRAAVLQRVRAAGGVSVPAMIGAILILFVTSFAIRSLAPSTALPVAAPAPVATDQPQPQQQSDPGMPPAGPNQQQPVQPDQPQPVDETYTPPQQQEEPPTEGFYDPPQ